MPTPKPSSRQTTPRCRREAATRARRRWWSPPGLAGLGVTARDAPVELDATFATLGKPTMPFVPSGSFITSSWFCPGVPSGEDGVGGSVEITNPLDTPIDGRITIYSSDIEADAVVQSLTIDARSNSSIDIAALQPTGAFASAVVEIDGGGGFVEQVARHPAGDAVAPCANAASSSWYFADGFTVDDSTEQLILSNPYPDAAIVNIGFVTANGIRNPSVLRAIRCPASRCRSSNWAAVRVTSRCWPPRCRPRAAGWWPRARSTSPAAAGWATA